MHLLIRHASVPQDYPAIVRVLSAENPEWPTTADWKNRCDVVFQKPVSGIRQRARPSTGKGEKHGQQEIQGNACWGGDPGQAKRDSVYYGPEQVLIADGSDSMRISIFVQEPILVCRIAPERIETNRCDHKRTAVNSRGKVLVRARGILGQKRCREGNKDDQQQKQQIECEQDIVSALDVSE